MAAPPEESLPIQLHASLGLVGGVGRSVVALLLSQWAPIVAPTRPLLLFDADPWGGWAFKGKVCTRPFGGLAFRDDVDKRLLDKVIVQMLEVGAIGVLDPGAALARDVAEYILEPVHAEFLLAHGQLVAHFVVVGGARQRATTDSALALAELLPPAATTVLWRNEFFDEIDGPVLEQQLATFPRGIDVCMDLPHRRTLLGSALSQLFVRGLTISEALMSPLVSNTAARCLQEFGRQMVERLYWLARLPRRPGSTSCGS